MNSLFNFAVRLLLPAVFAFISTGCVSTESLYARYDQPSCSASSGIEPTGVKPKACPGWHQVVLFAYNSIELAEPEQVRLLDNLAILINNPDYRLVLRGFTDSIASDGYNQPLSLHRVESVARWLQAHGIAPERITNNGLGKSWPLIIRSSSQSESVNRRVEMLLVDDSGVPVSFNEQNICLLKTTRMDGNDSSSSKSRIIPESR